MTQAKKTIWHIYFISLSLEVVLSSGIMSGFVDLKLVHQPTCDSWSKIGWRSGSDLDWDKKQMLLVVAYFQECMGVEGVKTFAQINKSRALYWFLRDHKNFNSTQVQYKHNNSKEHAWKSLFFFRCDSEICMITDNIDFVTKHMKWKK